MNQMFVKGQRVQFLWLRSLIVWEYGFLMIIIFV